MDKIADLHEWPNDLLLIAVLTNTKDISIIRRDMIVDTLHLIIIDVKMNVFQEDKLYELTPEYRALVPRGCCFIFINSVFQHALYGHPKFGNEGEFRSSSIKENPNDYDTVVFRRKENGECCHWSAFIHDGITYEVIGSKNVHLVVRSAHFAEDLLLYTEIRYTFAVKIAKLLHDNPSVSKNLPTILEYLTSTRFTFCGEHCSTEIEHLVKYAESKIMFFGITGQRINHNDPYTKVSPIHVDQCFKNLNLPVITETYIINRHDNTEIDKYRRYFELQENSEGAVIYYVKDGQAIYAYKHKNYNYIFRRALREKMKTKALSNQIIKRLDSLHIKHPDYENMCKFAIQFNAYYRTRSIEEQRGFFEKFVTWEERFKALSDIEKERITSTYMQEEQKTNILHVIMFVGIPGSGKSFLSRVLNKLLSTNTKNTKLSAHLEQDMFSSNKEYEKAIFKKTNDTNLKYLILSKSNHCIQVREATYRTLEKSNRNVQMTYILLNNNIEEEKDICIHRIQARGFAHKSILNKSHSEIENIVYNTFIRGFQELTNEEKENIVIRLNIYDDKITNLNELISGLNQHEVTDLKVTPELLNDTIKQVHQEDEELAEINLQKYCDRYLSVQYDALLIDNTSLIIDYELIRSYGLIMKDNFHVTLNYYGSTPESKLAPFEDDIPYNIQVTGYAINHKAMAYMVKLDKSGILDDTNISKQRTTPKIYHITIALKSGVPAVYSNELLQEAIKNNSLVLYDKPYTVIGRTKRIGNIKCGPITFV